MTIIIGALLDLPSWISYRDFEDMMYYSGGLIITGLVGSILLTLATLCCQRRRFVGIQQMRNITNFEDGKVTNGSVLNYEESKLVMSFCC